jgi:4-carboxymuconolactone decarboxylase
VDGEGRLNGPFNAMVVAPQIGGALEQVGASLRSRSSLSRRAQEIAVLVVAATKRSGFLLYAHTGIARASGLTDAEIADLTAGRRSTSFDDHDDGVFDLAARLVAETAVPDEDFERFSALLGQPGIVEVSTLVGYYALLAQQLALFEVETPR